MYLIIKDNTRGHARINERCYNECKSWLQWEWTTSHFSSLCFSSRQTFHSFLPCSLKHYHSLSTRTMIFLKKVCYSFQHRAQDYNQGGQLAWLCLKVIKSTHKLLPTCITFQTNCLIHYTFFGCVHRNPDHTFHWPQIVILIITHQKETDFMNKSHWLGHRVSVHVCLPMSSLWPRCDSWVN